jgi:hypothetical protein
MAGPTGVPFVLHGDDGPVAVRQGRALPAWRSVLAVVAHPDDESLLLGVILVPSGPTRGPNWSHRAYPRASIGGLARPAIAGQGLKFALSACSFSKVVST